MSKKTTWLFFVSIIAFAGLLGLAYLFQSDMCIFAASAMPIFIVLFLPDKKRYQYIRIRRDRKNISIFKQAGGEESLVVISFKPGFLRWNCSKLYFHLNDIAPEAKPGEAAAQASGAAASVLAYDLSGHRRKQGWIGINLRQLAQRTANLSYTTDEISRLVIRMQDLEETALSMVAPAAASPSKKKSISA
ncbi:hypothetical protein N0M98_22785 [Paenibacillus doosanensis]|uniref:Uncharacterized protein n=1 Tax=Paenibacillus konkukensis TaxID=2020716 RepID=A0ABY4RN09_9BACL|nr:MULTISPECIES: hypothetical protein [Paenibacillus]MCS7462956.1 hypothetical protein [Paenibacillus doosanensis]UQZ83862.1 hypothetical protein SK3146_03069 [Paenibacillus konkukensis]